MVHMPDAQSDKPQNDKTPATAAKTAAKPPAKTGNAAPPAHVGEGNPLHKKLRLRSGDTGLVIAPPQGEDDPLLPLPEGFSVLAGLGELASCEGLFDYVHVFARDKTELAEAFGQLRDRLAPGGSLWISWLKLTSKRGGGQAIDLNENVVRRLGLTHGLVDVKVAMLDRDWSALLLVRRKR
jgi:hypothetical protein